MKRSISHAADAAASQAFDAWFSEVAPEDLEWLVLATMRRYGRDAGEPDTRAVWTQRVRDFVRTRWWAQRRAVADEQRTLERALRGQKPLVGWRFGHYEVPTLPADHVELRRRLARAIVERDAVGIRARIREAISPFCPAYDWDAPPGAQSHARAFLSVDLGRLVDLGARELRAQGALEDACEAFTMSYARRVPEHDFGLGEREVCVRPFRWCHGLPTEGMHSGDGPYIDRADTQTLEHVWRDYDHVVGCGTTITHEILDMLSVPRAKQHVVEFHRWCARPQAGVLPRLQGRVVIVDDVHEGETAFTFSRLYRAAVVNVSNFNCSSIFPGERVVCNVDPDAELCAALGIADLASEWPE